MKKKEQKELPSWRDDEIIRAKTKMSHDVADWLNQTLVPLCRECNIKLGEDSYRDYFQDFDLVGEVYIENAVKSVDNSYLADAVRDSASKRFMEIRERYDRALPKPVKYGLGYGGERAKVTPESIIQYLRLSGGEFCVDEEAIVVEHTHYIKSDAYEKVEMMCEAINGVFNGRFDQNLLLGMLYYENGRVRPYTKFNWQLLEK